MSVQALRDERWLPAGPSARPSVVAGALVTMATRTAFPTTPMFRRWVAPWSTTPVAVVRSIGMSLAMFLLRALSVVLERYLRRGQWSFRRDHLQFRRDDLLFRRAGLLFRYDDRLLQRRRLILKHGGSAPGGGYVQL